jgi:predicted CXXCH cytochrome family protein
MMAPVRWLLGSVVVLSLCAQQDEAGKILRPADKSAHVKGSIDIVATAPSGKLELDGKPIPVEQPFPNVFHGVLQAAPGQHTLVLKWDGGQKEVRFFAGPNAPASFTPFVEHPPNAGVECTQCHELSSRGRFRFKGGCFECHTQFRQQEAFAKVHTHPPSVLEQCGMCHNAHGSTVKSHLLHSKENACKICHN